MTRHRVRQGECLTTIAEHYGFSWQTIWNDSGNADLKATRGDPNVLMPEDLLVIPDKGPKRESCATEACHRFVKKGIPPSFRLILTTTDGKAIKNEKYILKIGAKTIESTTDDVGGLTHSIPTDTIHCEISVPSLGLILPVELGHLDPIDTTEGVQQRLSNLGFPCGQIDGRLKEQTELAIQAFKAEYNLSGEGLDSATRSKLQKVHGS